MRTLTRSILTIIIAIALSLAAQAQLCPEVFKNRIDSTQVSTAKKPMSVLKKVEAIHTKAFNHLYGKVIEVGGDAKTLFFLMQGRGGLNKTLVDAYVPHDMAMNEAKYPTDRKVDPRFVKKAKLVKMLSVELNELLSVKGVVEKIEAENKRPFVFANTSETRHDKKGLAWLGLRIKFEDGFYDFRLQVTLHNLRTEQKDLGQLGINLIHGVMEHVNSPADPVSQKRLVESLFDNFKDVERSIKLRAYPKTPAALKAMTADTRWRQAS